MFLITDSAENLDTSCSEDCPPKTTATLIFFPIRYQPPVLK